MKTKFISGIIMITALTACEKKLGQVPISQASVANFFRNTADFEQAVNGIYQALHNVPNTYDYAIRQNELSEIRSDNIYSPGTSGVRDWLPINNFDKTLATNPNINGLWNDNFNGILRANTVLDKLDATLVPDNATRDRMEGEAKFFRAFYYFDLVRYVGKVPIFDHVATPSEALTIPRSSVADVYNLIISDLQTAVSKLPATYPTTQKGKMTNYAAKGILALVYLTRSGPTYSIEGPGLATNEYAQALTLLNDIISSNKYSLQPTYAAVFSYTNENNSEIIFDIQNIDPGTTANAGLGTELPVWMYETTYGQKFLGFAGGVDVDGAKTPSASLINSFEPADVRDNFSILPSYTDLNGNLQNRPQFVKFLDLTKKPLIRFNFAINYPILRYADVLLMKAEAILRGGTGGTQADVDALVKLVRDRAGLTGTILTNVTLDQLLTERQHEFMAEGKRWHDLVRTGKVLTVMAATDAIDDVINKQNIPTKDDIIYPIPFNQLSISPGLYTQNPTY
ncbi:MAG TPA: RagB/SusD family nutrient uptake outer membrane protein [Chitinophagaceae bacterium]|nr:RagB/SusD family nutrient uptake outer membrane protein [Chitinophagaceae bacterium]